MITKEQFEQAVKQEEDAKAIINAYLGGYPVIFQLVDWFYPFSPQDIYGTKTMTIEGEEYDKHIQMLKEFIGNKVYATAPLLAITDYGDAFVVRPAK